MSQEEVEDILKTTEGKLGSVDTSTPSGRLKWRALHDEKKLYQEILQTHCEMEKAKTSGNGITLSMIRDVMEDLQERALGQAHSPPQRGLLDGIKRFCYRPRSTESSSGTKKDSGTKGKTVKKSRKRKAKPPPSSRAAKNKRSEEHSTPYTTASGRPIVQPENFAADFCGKGSADLLSLNKNPVDSTENDGNEFNELVRARVIEPSLSDPKRQSYLHQISHSKVQEEQCASKHTCTED